MSASVRMMAWSSSTTRTRMGASRSAFNDVMQHFRHFLDGKGFLEVGVDELTRDVSVDLLLGAGTPAVQDQRRLGADLVHREHRVAGAGGAEVHVQQDR